MAGRVVSQQAEGLPRIHQPQQRARMVVTHQDSFYTEINGILSAFLLCSGYKGWLQFLLLAKVSASTGTRLQLDGWVMASLADFDEGVGA